MAIVLSNQQNIEFLLFLSHLAIALGGLAIVLWLCFWLRIIRLEKRMYRYRQHFHSRPRSKSAARHQKLATSIPTSMRHGQKRPNTMMRPVRQRQLRWQWLLAIAIASITGMAIAMLQVGNGLFSPELNSMIWVLIGVLLVASATFVEVR